MRKWWYSIALKRPGLIKSLHLAIAVYLVLASCTGFASTPEWLRQSVRIPLPGYPDDTDSVVLLDERIITVSSAGEIRTTHRRAFKILRPQGRNLGIVRVDFDSETQLAFLKGWSITAKNEEYEVKENSAIETSLFSESLYADTRYKVLQIPAAQPGSVVGYEYQQRQRPKIMQDIWSFQYDIPVRQARLVLELPPGWSYTTYWRNHAPVPPRQSGEHRWTWELTDIEPIKAEPRMPTWRSVAGQLSISFFPMSRSVSEGPEGSWTKVGRWYTELTRGRRELTPEIRDKTSLVLAGTGNPLDKIRKLASFVQRSIRYVAIEIGIGGFQPHAAQDVLANGYGDCKDKATLLSAMLKEAGIESYYVLLNDDRDYLSAEFPSPLGFNHVILAIRVPSTIDSRDLPAMVSHPRVGALLLFDPTDTFTPFGYLPPSLQSSPALLVTDEGGELITLPLLPPVTNRLSRVASLTLDKSGTLQGTVEEVRDGPAAVELRERLLNTPDKQRQKVFQDLLEELLDGAVLTSASITGLKDSTESLAVKYGFTAYGFAQTAGGLFLFRTCALGHKSSDLLDGKARRQPVVFSRTLLESDAFDITLPAEYPIDELPIPVNYDYSFATYKSEVRVAEHVLHYARTYVLRDVRVPIDKLEDLRTFFGQIAADEHSYAVLKSVPSASSLTP